MASKLGRALLFGGGLLSIGVAGCGSGEDNSPSMGKVAPKPNPNMNAQLPPEIREQMSQAKPGADAAQMSHMKPHTKS
jgi:hypothetical protein